MPANVARQFDRNKANQKWDQEEGTRVALSNDISVFVQKEGRQKRKQEEEGRIRVLKVGNTRSTAWNNPGRPTEKIGKDIK